MFKLKLKFNGECKPIICTKTLTLNDPNLGCVVYNGVEYKFIKGGKRIPTIEGHVPFIIKNIIKHYHLAAKKYTYYYNPNEFSYTQEGSYDYDEHYKFRNNRELYFVCNLYWCNIAGDFGNYKNIDKKTIIFKSINGSEYRINKRQLYRNAVKKYKNKYYIRLYNVVPQYQILCVLWCLKPVPKYIKIKILSYIWNIFNAIKI